MNRITFPSIQNPNRRYTWNRSAYDSNWRWDWRGSSPLHACAGYFDTLGDGDIQHTPECPAALNDALDYLASLASYLDEHNDPETLETIANDCPKPNYSINPAAVKFAAELRYKDGKTIYYSTEQRKTSTSDSKRHDKRWEKLEEWADGSLAAIVRLAASEFARGLERYAEIDKICDTLTGLAIDAPSTSYRERAELCGLVPRDDNWNSEYRETANNIHTAFNAVNHYILAEREREYARRSFSCLKNNYIDRHAPESTEAA